jgi:P-type E1-E2 ATPase
MALFIVTCPCALAMSAPVATLVSLSRLARRGTVLKGADVIEHVSRADTVFLDKTGTLTEGRLRVIEWSFAADTAGADEIRQAVYELERKSNHPIGIALADELERGGIRHRFEVDGLREEIGKGISGRVERRRYEIVRSAALSPDAANIGDGEVKTAISIRREDRIVAEVTLGDRLREDSKEAVAWLAAHGVTPHLLSGDVAAPVLQTAAALSIPGERARSGCSPEDKLAMVQDRPRTLMVGDGANDSAALAAATVGIAVHGGMEISLSVADVYLQKPGLQPIVLLIRGARETMAVIRRNLAFSLLYNLVGATAAAMGLMSPLFAAVLMPISSVTILSLSLWGAKSLR